MEISFENKNLRRLCESQNRAKNQLGDISAQKLKNLLADLDALNNVAEMLSLRIHNLTIGKDGIFTIELAENSKIVFSANHLQTPLLTNKAVDWSKVTRIKILSLEQGTNDEK